MEEIFKDIKGYEGMYQVSNFGRVRSFLKWDRDSNSERIIKPFTNKHGYLMVFLYTNGTPKCKKIHRLVAETFLENPLNHPQVNHIDSDKNNNSLTNLEFCSSSQNIQHSYDNGRVPAWLGKKMTAEHCKKLSEARMLSKNSRAKKTIDLVTGEIYGCATELAIKKGIKASTLTHAMSKNPGNKHQAMWLADYEKHERLVNK